MTLICKTELTVPAQIAALAADNDDDMALGVARRKKGPVPKLLSNEKCKGNFNNGCDWA